MRLGGLHAAFVAKQHAELASAYQVLSSYFLSKYELNAW